MFLELFHKIEMDGKLADSFYETKTSYIKTYIKSVFNTICQSPCCTYI